MDTDKPTPKELELAGQQKLDLPSPWKRGEYEGGDDDLPTMDEIYARENTQR